MTVPALPCTAISTTPTGLSITVPGGATICLTFPSAGLPSAIAGSKALLAQANTAIAPLMPFFKIVECLDAAKDLLWSPDTFYTKLLDVLAMAPQYSVPLLVANALDILLTYLTGLYAQLQAFVTQLAAIDAASTKAITLGCAPLADAVNCATAQMTLQMQGINDGVTPLNALVTTMNLLLALVPGAPTIPSFTDLGDDPEDALAPLQAAITALQAIRDLPFFP